ncbi:hypothetical protein WOLCODRAFT_109785 [Wolfiporia cocos MD-104 SS10]|uniref:Velvet domain-containing protein n=1 Tax=Wolfiporia cocos (strain MD-104) TaxID=742152 RepID=A0A2H3J557_WOLCO|nr:hypothetical protein WOLCODRAFT_109785 [Wolfiporia cocos MD-104 SS10]
MPHGTAHVHSAGSSQIGGPVAFREGQYAGRTLRAELEELQKADLGRRYARKDRRPLDPPPVVQFRLFEVLDAGTPRQREREFDCHDDLNSFGFVCHVDLYPVPDEDDIREFYSGAGLPFPSHAEPAIPPMTMTSALHQPAHSLRPPSSTFATPPLIPYARHHQLSCSREGPLPPQYSPYPPAPLHAPPCPAAFPPLTYHLHAVPQSSPYAGAPAYSPRSPPPHALSPVPVADPDMIAYLGDFAIREHTKCTGALIGATFVQPAGVEYKGRRLLIFVFADLAVKLEGSFVLRYRVSNLFSKANGPADVPMLAECFGGPFRVYSTREFPGLHASTDLTKHISFYGVRLNLRENVRKRRRKCEIQAEWSGDAATETEAGRRSAASENYSPAASESTSAGTGTRAGRSHQRQSKRRFYNYSSGEEDDVDMRG